MLYLHKKKQQKTLFSKYVASSNNMPVIVGYGDLATDDKKKFTRLRQTHRQQFKVLPGCRLSTLVPPSEVLLTMVGWGCGGAMLDTPCSVPQCY